MDKIHLIMPMGGGGTRFEKEGFKVPKPLIEIQDKPFFYWAAQSILNFIDVEDITFVTLQEHIDKFHIDRIIHEYYPAAKIHVIPHVLNGAVLTCLEGIKEIHDDLPILFNDCDHAFTSASFFEYCKNGEFTAPDGAILTFWSYAPCYSYVKLDNNGNVTKTVEKEVLSNEAICGAYYFKDKQTFEDAAQIYLKICSYQEFFMSGVYNTMIEMKQMVRTFPTDLHMSFGTPEEYQNICSSPVFRTFTK